MIIKNNYLYTNSETLESAVGGTDVLLTGEPGVILKEFMRRNGGMIVGKYVTVMPDEWESTSKQPII